MDNALLIWIIIVALLAVTEIATTAFVAIYLAIGAGGAAIVAAFDGGYPLQFAVFAIVGVVLMLLTRPFIKRKLETPDMPMNVDKVVGKTGIVTIAVDNDSNTGQIRVGTEFWTARRPDETPEGGALAAGSRVRVISVEGVTARVEPIVAATVVAPSGPETAGT